MSKQTRTMPTMEQVRAHWAQWVRETLGDEDESPVKLQDGRTGGLCFACGMYQPGCERAHIVARANGGPDSVENLHPLCPPCHKASEAFEGDEYWDWLRSWELTEAMLARAFWIDPGKAALLVAATIRGASIGTSQLSDLATAMVSENRSTAVITKAALAARKAAGVRLGRPVILAEQTRRLIVQLRAEGMTLQAIVDRLTADNVPTARGGRWSITSVSRVLRSMALDAEAAALDGA